MGRFITTKADFTLRRKHKTYSGATIYENDYTTINPMPNALKGEYVIGDSNFVFTSRLGINGQKKHVRGKFVPNPSDNPEERGAWTIDTIIDSGITNETRIRLKPNYTSLQDFACYGSAVKLVQGTINGVITDFPAELWFSNNESLNVYESNNGVGYSFNELDESGNTKTPSVEPILYNEYGIDITTKSVQDTSVYNPLRYFALCGSSYTLITVDDSGKTTGEYPFTGYEVKNTALGECYDGKEVEVDKVAVVTINFSGIVVCINVYKDYTDDATYYTYGECSGTTEEQITIIGDLNQENNPTETITIIGDLNQNPGDEERVTIVADLNQGTGNEERVTIVADLNQGTGNEEKVIITADLNQQEGEAPEELDISGVLNQFSPVVSSVSRKALRLGATTRASYVLDTFKGAHIRPKKEIVEEYFRTCDDFTYVLLDRIAKPIYTATFKAPKETDAGYFYDMVSYTWPSLLGGYNPDLSGPYYSYVESLIALAEYYDEFHCDHMWRSLTHEAIKTLDWTYISNSDGDIQDMSTIDTSRVEPITKIYGRQFDDLKRYIDAIKSINTITYDQKSNTPDYTLTDVLENSGWETKTLKITSDNDIRTDSLYSGLTSGYTSSDANNEFLRRLKLNSNYLFSVKGTRKGLDAMLALFGFLPEEYEVHEYIYVFSGTTFPRFCDSTKSLGQFAYPLAKDVATVNKYKVNFNAFDPYGDYCGIPVAEVGFWKNGKDYSYVVPWFSHGKNYDDGLYFQMHGGWGRRHAMDIDLDIAPNIKSITEWKDQQGNVVVPLYMETQARMRFAKDFDELLQEAYASSNQHDVFYVTDISKMSDDYHSVGSSEMENASHYFILENQNLNQYLGYSDGVGDYGWRSIANNEIQDPATYTAGTLVLYMESIQDDTTGNNPHIGNGTYDDGISYINGMSEIFAYSILNRNFVGIDDDTCEKIKDFKFDFVKQEDNRKCWFFTDNSNSGYGKNVACSKVYEDECCEPNKLRSDWKEFREVDVTDEICNLNRCTDPSPRKSGWTRPNCNESLGYDIVDLLMGAGENATVKIGQSANASGHFSSDAMKLYGRESSAVTFDPETSARGTNGEAAANSIVNVKNLDIHFKLPNFDDVNKEDFRRYIEISVIPYLTQMIPSTSILTWAFDSDEDSGKEETYGDMNIVGRLEQMG